MKVLEIIRSLEFGGSQQLLINRLSHEASKDHQTLVVNTLPERGATKELLTLAGVKVLDAWGRGPMARHRRVREMIATFQPDVIVVHSPAPAVLLKVDRILGLQRIPVVEVLHSTKYKRVVELAAISTNRGADRLLAVSNAVAETRLTSGSKHVKVVHHGVPVKDMRKWAHEHCDALAKIRGELLTGPSDILLVTVGRLVASKRQADLIEAIRLLRNPRIHLAIVGSGEMHADLTRLTERLHLAGHVHLLGEIPEAWKIMASADIACLPSAHEGLGVVLMESLALGKPIVASDIPGVREILTDGGNALLHAPGDVPAIARCIDALVSDSEYRSAVALSSLTSAEYWTTERGAANFYEELASVVVESLNT